MTHRGKPDPKLSRDPKESAQSSQGDPACTPLRPLPKLFVALLIAFAVWLGALLTLYFKTVYPLRHPSTEATTLPGASALPSAPR